MRVSPLLVFGILIGLIAAGGAVAALPACVSAQERDAMTLRSFQSSLMVAAVGCNQTQAYNAFASRYRAELSATGPALRSYFQRVYGRGDESRLNAFITDIANAWSQRHMANKQAYCEETWTTMWSLTQGPQATRQGLAQAVATRARVPEAAAVLCAGVSVPAAAPPSSR